MKWMGEQLGLDDVSSFSTHSTIKNEDFYDLAENAVGGNCEEVNGQLAVTAKKHNRNFSCRWTFRLQNNKCLRIL